MTALITVFLFVLIGRLYNISISHHKEYSSRKMCIRDRYGADAVYLAGKAYGLRAAAGNFTLEEMEEGVKFAHDRGKKVYVTLNIIPHNSDLKGLDRYIKDIDRIGAVSYTHLQSLQHNHKPSLRLQTLIGQGNPF